MHKQSKVSKKCLKYLEKKNLEISITISLAKMHMLFHTPKKKKQEQNDCNKKREDSPEADGLRDTNINPISILPTMKCLSAMMLHS